MMCVNSMAMPWMKVARESGYGVACRLHYTVVLFYVVTAAVAMLHPGKIMRPGTLRFMS